MTTCTVTGLLIDPSGEPLPGAAVTFARVQRVAGTGSATLIGRDRTAVADAEGAIEIDLHPGQYLATVAGSRGDVFQFAVGVPDQPTAFLHECIEQAPAITPGLVQQAIAARDLARDYANKAEDSEVTAGLFSAFHWMRKARLWAVQAVGVPVAEGLFSAFHWATQSAASASSAAASSAAAGAASARLFVSDFSELASVPGYTSAGGRRATAAGDIWTVLRTNRQYLVIASAASGATWDYTGSGGVKFLALSQGMTVTSAQFGAVHDNTTDDHPALQRAIDFLSSIGGGRLVLSGRQTFINSTLATPICSGDYSIGVSGGIEIYGAPGTVITRKNAAPVNYAKTLLAQQERYSKAAIAVRGMHCRIVGLTVADSYIGIYFGDDTTRGISFASGSPQYSQWAHTSWNHIESVQYEGCGVGRYMESFRGCYYNTSVNEHAYRCQTGLVTHDFVNSVSKVNRNTWLGFRPNNCVIGAWFRDFNTNSLISFHPEGCALDRPTNVALQVVPTGLPDGTSSAGNTTPITFNDGAGIIMEGNQNNITASMIENCTIDVYLGGTDNKIDQTNWDDQGGKVYFRSSVNFGLPYRYQSRRTVIDPLFIEKAYAGGAEWPSWAQNAGMTLNTDRLFQQNMTVVSDRGAVLRRIQTTHTHIGAVNSAASFTVNLGPPLETTLRAERWRVIITGNAAGSRVYDLALTIVAGCLSSAWNRYHITSQTQVLANGAGSGTTSTSLACALSLSGSDLILTVTNNDAATLSDVSVLVEELT